MTKHVMIEDADLELAKGLFVGSVKLINKGLSKFTDEDAASILRIAKALDDAVDKPKEIVVEAPQPKVVKKRVRAKQKVADFVPNLCPTHPDKPLLRAPRTDCPGCWAGYGRLHPNELAMKRRDFERKQRLRDTTP